MVLWTPRLRRRGALVVPQFVQRNLYGAGNLRCSGRVHT